MSDAFAPRAGASMGHPTVGQRLDAFGGLLRCDRCGAEKTLEAGMPSRYLAVGWPEHCSRTMRWWTRRQLDEQRRERA